MPGSLLNPPYKESKQRLLEICGAYKRSCFLQHHRPRTLRLGIVYSRPDTGSKSRGVLLAKVSVTGARGLHYRLVFSPHEAVSDSNSWTWVDDLGDWGYPRKFLVAQRRGEWVLFPRIAAGRPGWVNVRHGPLQGELTGITDDVWLVREDPEPGNWSGPRRSRLSRSDGHGVKAYEIMTGTWETVTGSIYVQEIRDGVVHFRPEVPSDFNCGRNGTDPDTVPHYRTPVSALLDPDGVPRLSDAYARGC